MSINIDIKKHEKIFIDGYTGQRITDLRTKTPIYNKEESAGIDTINGRDEDAETEKENA